MTKLAALLLVLGACKGSSKEPAHHDGDKARKHPPDEMIDTSGCKPGDFDLDRFGKLYAEEAALGDQYPSDCAALSNAVLAWRDKHGEELSRLLLCWVGMMSEAMTKDPPELDAKLLSKLEPMDRAEKRIKMALERCPDAPFLK